ncbi:TadE family type IV pilus minor pilin [Actinokineospora soli]|uniref:TadE family type IV pilus minor pilin n=1 Tax=Actinokineospora soli TaxID=1048753 RepID=A0ABW2TGF7_9PSEU
MNDRGAVTVEAAFAVVGLVVVLGLVLAGGAAAVDQIRCVDAAGEAARLAARGDPERARAAALERAPSGASVRIDYSGGDVDVRVEVAGPLPGVRLAAEARSVLEPGVVQGETRGAPP